MTGQPPSFPPARRPTPEADPAPEQMPPSYPPPRDPPATDPAPARTSLTQRRPKKSLEPRTPTGGTGGLTIQTETPAARVVDRGMSERVHHPAPRAAAPATSPGPAVSTGLTDRLAEVRAVKARHRRTILGVVAGAVAALVLAGWVIGFSPLLALDTDNITVVGASELVSTADIAGVVAPYAGTPLLRVDTDAITHDLRAEVAVKDADVVRQWPSGLHITIQVRTPVAVTQTEDEFTVLDGDGVTLARVDQAPENLPLVDVPVDQADTAASVAAVLTVMGALPPEILSQVATAGAKNPDEVTFTLDSEATVIWGSAAESDLKAAVLLTLLQVEASVYNVAAPLSPITT